VPEEDSFFVLASLLPLLPALSLSLSFDRESCPLSKELVLAIAFGARSKQLGYAPPSDGNPSSCSSAQWNGRRDQRMLLWKGTPAL
jgi:hypothetical protein